MSLSLFGTLLDLVGSGFLSKIKFGLCLGSWVGWFSWLVGCLGFNDSYRQYFSVSPIKQRDNEERCG